jgi:6-pyruvoyl-tetrahydropterin synthase
VNYSSRATVMFGAGHPPNGFCGPHAHGHRYRVTVTWKREGAQTKDLDDFEAARARIVDLAYEVTNRDLAKMLGPMAPNVYGLAAFFMERLSLHLDVTQVEVTEDDNPTAVIDRD